MENQQNKQSSKIFPPVVSVLGHVDHGKTSLLDAIRKTDLTAKEKGGITQRIGASQIEVKHEGILRKITFIDTPGHEAFANMRSQGVSASDIVLLIVAADDGVKPQTRESIEKIHEANIPYIVVFTKTDLETANLEKVKQEVLKEGVLLEGLGGQVPFIGVSSKNGENITALLDLVLLVYDLSKVEKNSSQDCLGVVVDAKLDKRRGIVSTIVLKQGSLSVGEKIYIPGKEVGKVRAITSANLQNVKAVEPGDACELLGLTEVLPTGSVLTTKEVNLLPVERQVELPKIKDKLDLATFFGEEKKGLLPVVLKTETSGEMEAVKNALPSDVQVVFEGQGDIASSDILLAKDFKAFVIGFNVNISKDAQRLAESEKVFFRMYHIIYELLDEVEEAIEALEEEGKEKILGSASVLAKFQGKEGFILGMRVNEGRVAINDKVRIMRGNKEIASTKVLTLKRQKNDIKEAGKGIECGATLQQSVDFSPGDVLISYS